VPSQPRCLRSHTYAPAHPEYLSLNPKALASRSLLWPDAEDSQSRTAVETIPVTAGTLYVRENWDAGATFDSNLSSSTGAFASTRNSLTLVGRHLLPPKNWFYAGLGGLLESSEQGISLQSVVGGGVGRYLKNTNRASIQLLGGLAWQDTSYQRSTVSVSKQNTAAALIYARGSLSKFSKTNLDATAAILPALSDLGRVHIDANATYYIKIVSNLKWNVSFYGNWDNRPPPGLSGSDYGTSSGLSWTFGLK
jgi:uncharacterized protein DUF481